jgi:hypothetical protein
MKTTTRKPAKRRPNGAIANLAKSLKISTRHTSELLKAGMPLDPAKAAAWRAEQSGSSASDSAERLRLERIQLVRAQRERQEIENDRARGALISRVDVQTSDTRIGSAVRAAMLVFERDLPGKLVGLGHSRMQEVLHNETRNILALLADSQSAFWTDHPEKA